MRTHFFVLALFTISFLPIESINCQNGYYFTDFEDSIVNWIVLDTSSQNLWQIGEVNKQSFNSAYSGQKVLVTDTAQSYGINAHSSFMLKTPTHDEFFNPLTNMYLELYHKYDTDSLNDGGYLEISYNNGISWRNVINDTVIVYDSIDPMDRGGFAWVGYSSSDTLTSGIPAFTSRQMEWEKCFFSRGYGLGKSLPNDTIILRFTFISDELDNKNSGWVIDDLNFLVDYGIVGIDNNTIENHIKTYPNPVNDNLTIRVSRHKVNYIKIIEPSGNVVKSFQPSQLSEIKLSTSNLAPGIYFYVLYGQDWSYSGKFLKK